MTETYTARFTRLEGGYLGQVVEWPEVITEGETIETCQAMLEDALAEMVAAYRELGKEIPRGSSLTASIHADI